MKQLDHLLKSSRVSGDLNLTDHSFRGIFESPTQFYALFGSATCGDNQNPPSDFSNLSTGENRSLEAKVSKLSESASIDPYNIEFHTLIGSTTCGGRETSPEPTHDHPLFDKIHRLLEEF